RRVVRLEPPTLQKLDHAHWLRVGPLAGQLVLDRHAYHLRIAAQKDMRVGWVQWYAELFLQFAARDRVLDVDLLGQARLPRGEWQIPVVRVMLHQVLVDGEIAEIAVVPNAAGRQDAALMSAPK